MGVDQADKLKEQGLPAFAEMAVKHSCGRWSLLDAEVYYNKIMKEAGLECEALPVVESADELVDAGKVNSDTGQAGGEIQNEPSMHEGDIDPKESDASIEQ